MINNGIEEMEMMIISPNDRSWIDWAIFLFWEPSQDSDPS